MTHDEYLFVHDAATVSFDSVETTGITVDDEGTTTFEWNEIPVVEVDQPPHARAFETDQFYKIEGATVARPIKQPYAVGDDVEVYVKPADELRDAAWSLDNRPFVLGHPSTGMVKDVRDVHGFWRNPRYDDDGDRLKQDLYVPKNDEEAKEFIAENDDVSLGFYNLVHREYDGDIGGLVSDEEDVDGYQVNLFVDHIAGVERGRCSSAHGCGLDDPHDHGKVVGQPDEAAVEAADGADKNDPDADTDNEPESHMTDSPDDTENTEDGFDIPEVSVDALAERNDSVRELQEAKDALESDLEEVREGLGLDEDECPCDADLESYADAKETIGELHDTFEEDVDLVEFVSDMHEEWREARDEKREELLDELEDLKADREDFEDADLDTIEDELERRKEIAEDFDASAVGGSNDSEESRIDGERTSTMGTREFGRGLGT